MSWNHFQIIPSTIYVMTPSMSLKFETNIRKFFNQISLFQKPFPHFLIIFYFPYISQQNNTHLIHIIVYITILLLSSIFINSEIP